MDLNPFDVCPCGSGKIYKECHGNKNRVNNGGKGEHPSSAPRNGSFDEKKDIESSEKRQEKTSPIPEIQIEEKVEPEEPVLIPQPEINEPRIIPPSEVAEPNLIPQPVRNPVPTNQECQTVQKGQRVTLGNHSDIGKIRCDMGWNVKNLKCSIDVSAFLLGKSGKVPSEEWFVFYQQTASPDGAVTFKETNKGNVRESIDIDFAKISNEVNKIVFVLTIDEAFDRQLNFSMVNDVFIKVKSVDGHRDLYEYNMEEYYASITSVMIGEIYRRNNEWKFHIIGNGVNKDLAGLCELYGVETE